MSGSPTARAPTARAISSSSSRPKASLLTLARRRSRRQRRVPSARRRARRPEWRRLRRRRPRARLLQRAHREVFEGDGKFHQELGPPRLGARRIRRRALLGNGLARPLVRRRSNQQPDRDLRSGTAISLPSGSSSVARAGSTSTRTTCFTLPIPESIDSVVRWTGPFDFLPKGYGYNPGVKRGIRIRQRDRRHRGRGPSSPIRRRSSSRHRRALRKVSWSDSRGVVYGAEGRRGAESFGTSGSDGRPLGRAGWQKRDGAMRLCLGVSLCTLALFDGERSFRRPKEGPLAVEKRERAERNAETKTHCFGFRFFFRPS